MIEYNRAIYVDSSVVKFNEFQNETRFWHDVHLKGLSKHLIIDVVDNSNYIDYSNGSGYSEMQFQNTNANGTDDRLVRIIGSTGAGGSGDWGGRLFIKTRVNGGTTFKSFMFDDTGKFDSDKVQTDNLVLSSATTSGSVNMDASTPEVTVNASAGGVAVTTDGTLATGVVTSKAIKVNSNQITNGLAAIILHQATFGVGILTEAIVTKVSAGSFEFVIRNIASGTLGDDAILNYTFAVINRPL